MNDKEVLKQLKMMQSMKASDRLHERMRAMVPILPSKQAGFSYPLFAFRTTVAFAVLLLVLGMGSGMVAAAKLVKPGTPLYPVRQVIEKIPLPVFHSEPVVPTTIPTVEPTKEEKQPVHEDQKEQNNTRPVDLHKEVQGVSDGPKTEGVVDEKSVTPPVPHVKEIHADNKETNVLLSLTPTPSVEKDGGDK